METTKTLIHQDDQQVSRITEEVTIRLRLLNAMIDAGISPNEIPNVVSRQYIDDVLFQKHLKLNKTMAQEFAAGKRQKHLMEVYVLGDELNYVKGIMEQWLNYPLPHRGFDKFRHLKLVNGRYELNQETIEQEFIMNKYKIYADDRVIDKVKKLDPIIDILIEDNEPSGRAMGYQYLAERLTCDSNLACNRLPQKRFMVKRAYALGLMDQRV